MNPKCNKMGHGHAYMRVCMDCNNVSCGKCAKDNKLVNNTTMCSACRSQNTKTPSEAMILRKRKAA